MMHRVSLPNVWVVVDCVVGGVVATVVGVGISVNISTTSAKIRVISYEHKFLKLNKHQLVSVVLFFKCAL